VPFSKRSCSSCFPSFPSVFLRSLMGTSLFHRLGPTEREGSLPLEVPHLLHPRTSKDKDRNLLGLRRFSRPQARICLDDRGNLANSSGVVKENELREIVDLPGRWHWGGQFFHFGEPDFTDPYSFKRGRPVNRTPPSLTSHSFGLVAPSSPRPGTAAPSLSEPTHGPRPSHDR
jgi:hypothetical protein